MCHFYKDRAVCDENCAVLRHFCAEVITYKKKVLYSEELRIIEDIKQVFQTKTGNVLLLCMPELRTVFSFYFASKSEGREVHDLQRAFWKLTQQFSAQFLRAELNVLNRLVFASHMF